MKIALNHLKKGEANLNKYHYLQASLLICDVEKDLNFQTVFRDFYKMNLARKSQEWYKMFFSTLQLEKHNSAISFCSVLEKVFEWAKKFEKTIRVESSFCSKLVATINPNLPVWDQKVLANLDLTSPSDQDSEKRLRHCIKVYSCLKTWSEKAIQEDCFEEWKKRFDGSFPQFQCFTDMKKLDLFLWQLR